MNIIRIFLPILSRDYNSRNHRKVVVIDGKVGYMGGMNINFRGSEQDFEINAFMYDENLARQQREIFLEDQKDAELTEPVK